MIEMCDRACMLLLGENEAADARGRSRDTWHAQAGLRDSARCERGQISASLQRRRVDRYRLEALKEPAS
jgi:hypothetical protein